MKPLTASVLCASLLVIAGCKGSGPESRVASVPAYARVEPSKQAVAYAEKASAYAKEHPWGDYTGTSRLRGVVAWSDGSEPPVPMVRRPLVLKGIKGTSSYGLYYRLRANERGEFDFDRIKGGEFKLSDDITGGFHWRLRVEIRDGQDVTLDLTRDNSITVRDDFPETTDASGPNATPASADAGPDRESQTASRLDDPTAATVTER